MSEEDFLLSFRNMSLPDALSTFAVSVGKYRPVSHADTTNTKKLKLPIHCIVFPLWSWVIMELDKQISLISFAREVKY